MTTRASRYIDLFEGFKLGSLGARSKKPIAVVPEPQEPKAVVPKSPRDMGYDIIQQEFLDAPKFHSPWWIDTVYWIEEIRPTPKMEPNFKCVMILSVTSAYDITVYGGHVLKLNKDRLQVRGSEFDASLVFNDSSNDSAQRFFRDIFRSIEKEGSFGLALAKGKIGTDWEFSPESDPDDYFDATTSMVDPPNYKKG
jgi:hypothetical protein